VAFVAPSSFTWVTLPEAASTYITPMGVSRRFCGNCATPIFNFSNAEELGCVITQSLESARPAPWAHVNTESKDPWLTIADDLPQFRAWPSPAQLRRLLEAHPGSWVPSRLVESTR
jgi:hypothetical protein